MHVQYGKVGLLLNGGGAKGIIQAGSIQAFVDHGIEYDVIYGSSVGSLNGAMLHQWKLQELKALWMEIRTKHVYKWGFGDVLRPFNSACLFDSTPLLNLIRQKVDPGLLYRTDKQFYISATNFSAWSPIILSPREMTPEETHTLLYASSSPPVYFPLVPFRGQLLADAGVLTNYNIAKAVKDGCDTLVVMGFAVPEPRTPANLKDVLAETMSISMYGYFDRELSFVQKVNELLIGMPCGGYRQIKVVRILPERPTGIDLLDFDYKQERKKLWQYGYDLAAKILEEQLPCL